MSKCTHGGTVSVTEEGTWYTEHIVEANGEVWHNNEPGNYSGMVVVKCDSCGRRYRFNRHNTIGRLPRWIQTALDRAFAHATTRPTHGGSDASL